MNCKGSSNNKAMQKAIDIITRKFLDSGKRTIFIEGIDASGKTYFSRRIKKSLERRGLTSCIVGSDEFLVDRNARITNGVSSSDSYLTKWFDFERMRKEILVPFSLNGRLSRTISIYNEKSGLNDRQRRIHIAKDSILIVEGVFLSNNKLKSFPAFRILLLVPFELSMKRQLRREPSVRKISKSEALFRWNNWHLPAQKHYLASYQPQKIADSIIDNSDYNSPRIIKIR